METRKADNERMVAIVRAVAKEHGWAIGSHGSMVRDIDCIAAPWTAEHCTPEELVEAIKAATGYSSYGHLLGAPRPGGRRSIILMHPDAEFEQTDKGTWTPAALDLSILPDYRDARLAPEGQHPD